MTFLLVKSDKSSFIVRIYKNLNVHTVIINKNEIESHTGQTKMTFVL